MVSIPGTDDNEMLKQDGSLCYALYFSQPWVYPVLMGYAQGYLTYAHTTVDC